MNPRHPSRQTYVLEQKRRRPSLPPVSESRLRAAASPAFDKALPECSPTYPWKKLPNGLEKRGNLVTWSRTSHADGASIGRRSPSVACSGVAALLPELPSGWKAAESKAAYLPRLALAHSAWFGSERPESGGIGCCLRPTPTLRPHCPIYSSSDSRTSGRALTRSDLPGGGGRLDRAKRSATHAHPGAHFAMVTLHG